MLRSRVCSGRTPVRGVSRLASRDASLRTRTASIASGSHAIQLKPVQYSTRKRFSSTAAPAESDSPTPLNPVDRINALIERINENDDHMAGLMEELEVLDEVEDMEDFDYMKEFMSTRGEYTTDTWVPYVRQQFRDAIPEGVLNEEELRLYTSLYGEPVILDDIEEPMLAEDEGDADQLFREDGQGGWEEVEYREDVEAGDETPFVYDMDAAPELEETIAMQRTREVAEQLGGEVMLEQFENEAVPDATPRMHPLTQGGKFQTDPRTVFLPKNAMTGPVSVILSEVANKHVAETARRLFGGPGLPHSTTVAPPSAGLPQLPIPLHASQSQMSGMEANAYLSVLYPGIYASTLSVLTEVRKRLGTEWLRNLITQEGGPNVLDASGAGAGILAWRDVIRAEYEVMVPDHPKEAPVPYGRSAVLTGSDALRLRASALLENTTFLPRLPDYLHVRDAPTLDDSRPAPKRKQYDVIIAPHSLLGFEEDFERKEHVEKLWSLLNPDGGVLILLEKGRQKGFEAISGAREMLLKRYIASPGSEEYTNTIESPNSSATTKKETGMIIAPCTNHSTCPMHNPAGPIPGRRDYCAFEQRYIRPDFLQRIMGAKDHNHEDVKFSYLAVQRGVDLRQEHGIQQSKEATDAAFEGFEEIDEADPESQAKFHHLSLPRMVFPPLKRQGHVIMDLCTPAGKIERWTVPRSFSRQAYRDARKSHWGDLWALGAKTSIPRHLKLYDKRGEGKKERLARRAATKAAQQEEEDFTGENNAGEEEVEFDDEERVRADPLQAPKRKRGQNIPSWKKHNDKKKMRQAERRQSAE
ncbi:Ribosomal protein Rsm22 bacterial-type [Penicillium chermesinum]|uniref:Ribosomal protein Rsm22 bacterial-type n=1 Tax=Penicillium chermesinum TaxID=63820 RepID=A0A9W9PAH7_9EURO|nr:Ribosomal protein Rsm22 bacterial-type [Penicillium chermesinum]KAJ5239608.1 Ribosomal protein Rsm22 bacterial-type [Penicillium chermesinum]